MLFIISALFALVRAIFFAGFGAVILPLMFVGLSWLATKTKWIYLIGVGLSALSLFVLFSEPSRFVAGGGFLDQATLLGVLIPLALGLILFVLHLFLSGRWSEAN